MATAPSVAARRPTGRAAAERPVEESATFGPMADPSPDPTALAAVQSLLAAAGVNAPDSEVSALARAYPGLRRQIDRLYDVPTGDDVPIGVFRPESAR